MQLLTARIGSRRAAAEPGAVGEIASLCAHLPLALAVAAARAAARPRFPLTAAGGRTARCRRPPGRPGYRRPGRQRRGPCSPGPTSSSAAEAARLFRLLGLHPGPDISVPAAASLAAIEPGRRQPPLLRELARDCLITEHAPGRYAFHDLLRAYAASQAQEFDPQPDRDAATGRVLDYYLHTADRGASLLNPAKEPLALAAATAGTRPERPADHRQALAWFEAEHQVLLAAITLAAETGDGSPRLAALLGNDGISLLARATCMNGSRVMSGALAAATRLDDTLGQAMSLRCLGSAFTSTGDYDQARAHLDRCLPLYQRLGDRTGEARAQTESVDTSRASRGATPTLSVIAEQALRLYRAIGNETGEAEVLSDVGWCHALLGDYQQARAFCEQSLALIAKLGGLDVRVWRSGHPRLHRASYSATSPRPPPISNSRSACAGITATAPTRQRSSPTSATRATPPASCRRPGRPGSRRWPSTTTSIILTPPRSAPSSPA